MPTTFSTTDKSAGVTLSGGNLTATYGAAGNQAVRSADEQVTGKFYWEVTFTTAANTACGIANGLASITAIGVTNINSVNAAVMNTGGAVFLNGANSITGVGTVTNGTVVCVALDLVNQQLWFRIGAAGNWNGNAGYSPGGTGGISVASIVGGAFPAYAVVCAGNGSGSAQTANFGGSAFAGAVPSGFTSGFSSPSTLPVNMVATQAAAEIFATAIPPPMQVTQAALEMWGPTSGNTQMVVTNAAAEMWAAVAAAQTAQQARACILA